MKNTCVKNRNYVPSIQLVSQLVMILFFRSGEVNSYTARHVTAQLIRRVLRDACLASLRFVTKLWNDSDRSWEIDSLILTKLRRDEVSGITDDQLLPPTVRQVALPVLQGTSVGNSSLTWSSWDRMPLNRAARETHVPDTVINNGQSWHGESPSKSTPPVYAQLLPDDGHLGLYFYARVAYLG